MLWNLYLISRIRCSWTDLILESSISKVKGQIHRHLMQAFSLFRIYVNEMVMLPPPPPPKKKKKKKKMLGDLWWLSNKNDFWNHVQFLSFWITFLNCDLSPQGQPNPLNSAFHLTYNMVMNLLRVEGINPEYMLEKSFFQFQSYTAIPELFESKWRLFPSLMYSFVPILY